MISKTVFMKRLEYSRGKLRGLYCEENNRDSYRGRNSLKMCYDTDRLKEVMARISISIIAICFVLCFSYSTSPLYPFCFGGENGGDAAQFLTIGKAWAEGKIPYIELYDHKGPYIFFVNMLGFLLTGNKTGVFFIQILGMICVVNGLYNLIREIKNHYALDVLTVVIVLAVMKANYVNGDGSSEYVLPFSTWSVYLQIRYLNQIQKDRTVKHPALWGLLYGISFGVCAMSRLTDGIMLCSGVLIISIHLVCQGKYRNLLKNAAAFVGGTLLVICPFAVYFAYHHALPEMLSATFIQNYTYTRNIDSWTSGINLEKMLAFCQFFLPMYLLLPALLLEILKKKHLHACLFLLWGVLELYLCMQLPLYPQYALILAPQVAIILGELFDDEWMTNIKGIIRWVIVSIIVVHLCWVGVDTLFTTVTMYRKAQKPYKRGWEELIDAIPKDEKESIIAYGENALKDFYLVNDIVPLYEYFSLQEWHAMYNPETKRAIQEKYQQGNARWIIANGSVSNISDILELKYEMIASQNGYTLYRIKEDEKSID